MAYYPAYDSIADQPSSDELDLREIWRAVWRRKWLLVFTIGVFVAGALFYVERVTPRYTGKSVVRLIQPQEAETVDLPLLGTAFESGGPTLETELEYLQSRAFAARMVDELGLMSDPEYNSRLQPESAPFWESWGLGEYVPEDLVATVRGWVGLGGDAESPADPFQESGAATNPLFEGVSEEELTRSKVINRFLSAFSPQAVGNTLIISLGFESESPTKAARIAGAIAETYLQAQLERKYENSERLVTWLNERTEELRADVASAEQAIVSYQSERGLAGEGRQSSIELQLAQMNAELARAQTARAQAEARFNQTSAVRSNPALAADVLGSPLMQSLREQETQLLRRLSEMRSTFGDRHPTMLNLQAELDSIYAKMNQEVERIVSDFRNEVAVARAGERELQNQIAALQGQVAQQDSDSVELQALRRDADATRQVFEAFLLKAQQIIESRAIIRPDAEIMSNPEVPGSPSFPNKKLILIIAIGASLLVASGLIFVIERLDSDFGFRSSDEVLAATGLRALALVPDLSKRETRGNSAEDYILQKPNSAFAEALQRVRTSLFLGDPEQTPKTILVTSSVPFEGKTLLTASLARQSARSGLRVLLVDADLRRPRLHEIIRVANTDGLGDVLQGNVDTDAAVRTDGKSGLDFIPAGSMVASPPDLFRSEQMKQFLEDAADVYDLVLIDSPPVGAVSDSFILSGLIDRTLYVVRWEETPRDVAMAGIRQTVEAGANLAGVVLSRVNVKKHARYGYTDSGYYRGQYSRYYVN
ncbi:MAG: GumC family protein [Geminicoccaceae bacterium]